jgi:uncharacterized protein (TIGR01777 family)
VWTPERAGDWGRNLEGADALVHLAGAGVFDTRWSDERLALIRSSRVESTRVLAETLAQLSAPPPVWVSGSAIGYYGMREDDVELDENATPGHDVLARICVDWEAATAKASAHGVRVAHARIGLALGADGGALEPLLLAFRSFIGGPLGSGKQWFSWVHVDDVVRAILFAIGDKTLSGPFNITAPNPVTMNTLARELGSSLHRPSIFRVPSFALKLTMGSGRAQALLTGQRVLPKVLTSHGFAFDHTELRGALANILRA